MGGTTNVRLQVSSRGRARMPRGYEGPRACGFSEARPCAPTGHPLEVQHPVRYKLKVVGLFPAGAPLYSSTAAAQIATAEQLGHDTRRGEGAPSFLRGTTAFQCLANVLVPVPFPPVSTALTIYPSGVYRSRHGSEVIALFRASPLSSPEHSSSLLRSPESERYDSDTIARLQRNLVF